MNILIKTPLAIILSGLFIPASYAELYFPPEMVSSDGGGMADLSHFSADGSQVPGEYQVDVYVNQQFVYNEKIRFEAADTRSLKAGTTKDDTTLVPCLSRKMTELAGIKTELYPALAGLEEGQCVFPMTFIPGSYSAFDVQKLRLDLSIPQASVRNAARGEIPTERWDEGINAALMNYSFSGSNRFAGSSNSSSYFLSLDGGVNVGPWRLRDARTWSYYDSRYGHKQAWQHQRTYVERTVIPLRSSLTAGETTTDSNIFDSVGITGVQLATDDNMYPDSMRGFAPVVRGVANGNAEVTVRQNGYTIYRTAVSAGPFEITDLNPMYSSGDLQVSVKEAGGYTRIFTVPYASVPALQRQGHLKYSLAAGRFRGGSDRYDDPVFSQGALMWGLPHDVTLYGGTQYSSRYLALQSGVGVNLGRLGALSADITHARSQLADDSRHIGQSLRFLYAHAFTLTGTSVRLTGYRYSTRGFHTLDETALKNMRGRLSDPDLLDENGEPVRDTFVDFYDLYNSKRARLEADVSQSLGDFGSVWLGAYRQTYWNTQSSSDSFQAGYSNTLGPVSYSLNVGYTRQKNENAPSYSDRTVSLSLSVPLDRLFSSGEASRHPVYATFYANRSSQGETAQQAGLSGSAMDDNQLSWNLSQGYARQQQMSGNASANYRGTYGNANLGYSYNKDWQNVNYGFSGGALLHRNGLTLGQPLGETSMLIAANGAPGLSIQNEPGVRTDWRGYAIKPYASSYRENRVSIDSRTLDDQTEVENGATRVVPTQGAIVRADFSVQRGHRVLLTLNHDGKPLPFGTMVTSGHSSSIVGDEGQVFLSGMADSGVVNANWGSQQRCTARYSLSQTDISAPVVRLTASCQ
ncbi:fimbria/pilus outer membrane usher protein [Scandinavium sp.]|uniref:fimbria/pilus outer membrane usher protein n=1 Tax=Scandinavium sp. TaxID=2830653 RepID=UPI0028A15587|nr:fimbria/pilus outer membrane usher protein [Scandinavium sp.]